MHVCVYMYIYNNNKAHHTWTQCRCYWCAQRITAYLGRIPQMIQAVLVEAYSKTSVHKGQE